MNRILRLALNDLRLTLADRASLLWLLLLPLALMWFFGQIGNGGSGVNRISLPVRDLDGGWLAQELLRELEGEQVELVVLKGEIDPADPPIRVLVIPEGFTEALSRGERRALRLELSRRSAADYSLAAQTYISRAISRSLGNLAEMGPDGRALPAEEAAARFRRLSERPSPIGLRVSQAGTGVQVPNGYAQSVPGMLTMTVLMMTMIYGAVFLTTEKESGILRRLASLPMTRGEIFAGKLLGRLMVAGLQLVVLLVVVRIARPLFPLNFGDSPGGLVLLLACFAFSVAGISVFLGAVLSTPGQAEGISWIAGMFMAALGGCWWPGELMPDWLRTVAHLVPTAWAMDGFHALISFGRGFSAILLPAAVLFGFGLVFSLLGARYLRYD